MNNGNGDMSIAIAMIICGAIFIIAGIIQMVISKNKEEFNQGFECILVGITGIGALFAVVLILFIGLMWLIMDGIPSLLYKIFKRKNHD